MGNDNTKIDISCNSLNIGKEQSTMDVYSMLYVHNSLYIYNTLITNNIDVPESGTLTIGDPLSITNILGSTNMSNVSCTSIISNSLNSNSTLSLGTTTTNINIGNSNSIININNNININGDISCNNISCINTITNNINSNNTLLIGNTTTNIDIGNNNSIIKINNNTEIIGNIITKNIIGLNDKNELQGVIGLKTYYEMTEIDTNIPNFSPLFWNNTFLIVFNDGNNIDGSTIYLPLTANSGYTFTVRNQTGYILYLVIQNLESTDRIYYKNNVLDVYILFSNSSVTFYTITNKGYYVIGGI